MYVLCVPCAQDCGCPPEQHQSVQLHTVSTGAEANRHWTEPKRCELKKPTALMCISICEVRFVLKITFTSQRSGQRIGIGQRMYPIGIGQRMYRLA